MNWNNEKELTREELYERVWSAPTTQVAAELGISDVALAKRCRRLNVPKPPPGYWAKVAAGRKPPKPALPKKPVLVKLKASSRPAPGTIPLPETLDQLHPIAAEVMRRLGARKPRGGQRAVAEGSGVPHVSVRHALVEKAVKSLHAIILALEPHGILLNNSKNKFRNGEAYFERGSDWFTLTIDEKVDYFASLDWEGGGRCTEAPESAPRLSFEFHGNHIDGRNLFKRWAENDKRSLEEILFMVVRGILKYFEDLEQERVRAVESKIRQEQEDRIRQEAQRRHRHAEELESVLRKRTANLLKAGEWWRLHQAALGFIEACEQRWRAGSAGTLTAEQQAWLQWARETAGTASPFEIGYPDPEKDGPFDPASVPFGGPYPAARDIPHPPTMPNPAAAPPAGIYPGFPQPKPQFPFWLKYPK